MLNHSLIIMENQMTKIKVFVSTISRCGVSELDIKLNGDLVNLHNNLENLKERIQLSTIGYMI